MIRKSLLGIIDPDPSKEEITQLWEFFDSRCAYCGTKISRTGRQGQIDHLVPQSVNGMNHIFNRVLSCGHCNGDEKRDTHWAEFIINKYSSNPSVAKKRIDKIKEWRKLHKEQEFDSELRNKVEELTSHVCVHYNSAVRDLKKLRMNG
jgi:CRISPR/Cas system Type II protein with McrA/HNH and RuvC-like nuclease domain